MCDGLILMKGYLYGRDSDLSDAAKYDVACTSSGVVLNSTKPIGQTQKLHGLKLFVFWVLVFEILCRMEQRAFFLLKRGLFLF